jgi:anaerobic ribonucleoside-triphosphate reductase activating protein
MRYLGYYKTSIADGIGWRTVLFVSGCNHKCEGCHNPESWNPNHGKVFEESDYELLKQELLKPENSGLTLSGGDPLFPDNRKDTCKLVERIKADFPDKTIWLYTGYVWDEIKTLDLLKYVDVVVDGPFVIKELDTSLAFRGSKNQRIIDCQKSLKEGKVIEIEYK